MVGSIAVKPTVSGFDVVQAGPYALHQDGAEREHHQGPRRYPLRRPGHLDLHREEPHGPLRGAQRQLLVLRDSPFLLRDRGRPLLYFADLLHDILGRTTAVALRAHPHRGHQPIFRSGQPAEIADLLAERKIPFLVGVIPST